MINEKQKYECHYAESRGNVRNDGGGVFCRISGDNCIYVAYEFPFGVEIVREMNECPAYNIPQELAKALISARMDLKKSELESSIEQVERERDNVRKTNQEKRK